MRCACLLIACPHQSLDVHCRIFGILRIKGIRDEAAEFPVDTLREMCLVLPLSTLNHSLQVWSLHRWTITTAFPATSRKLQNLCFYRIFFFLPPRVKLPTKSHQKHPKYSLTFPVDRPVTAVTLPGMQLWSSCERRTSFMFGIRRSPREDKVNHEAVVWNRNCAPWCELDRRKPLIFKIH